MYRAARQSSKAPRWSWEKGKQIAGFVLEAAPKPQGDIGQGGANFTHRPGRGGIVRSGSWSGRESGDGAQVPEGYPIRSASSKWTPETPAVLGIRTDGHHRGRSRIDPDTGVIEIMRYKFGEMTSA